MGLQKEVVEKRDVLAEAQGAKAIQEIQAALVIANRFPRDLNRVYADVIASCKIPHLAEQSQYSYKRGNELVSGASIRLAEVLAQAYGNLDVGFKELSSNDGVSEVEAYAWDLQKNVRYTRVFRVAHVRETKKYGRTRLTSDRDIYEMIANQAQRRVRACILAAIPRHFEEAAIEQCNKTLAGGDLPIAERVKKLTSAFTELGVTIDMLEKYLGHKLSAVIETQLANLRGIYRSIRDGVSKREDWFEHEVLEVASEAEQEIKDVVKNSKKLEVKDEQ